MSSVMFDVIAIFTDKAHRADRVETCPNQKTAWNVAREWAIRGIENREKGHIIPLSMIHEIQVREHKPLEIHAAQEPPKELVNV